MLAKLYSIVHIFDVFSNLNFLKMTFYTKTVILLLRIIVAWGIILFLNCIALCSILLYNTLSCYVTISILFNRKMIIKCIRFLVMCLITIRNERTYTLYKSEILYTFYVKCNYTYIRVKLNSRSSAINRKSVRICILFYKFM